jgi:hypothetical protein
MTQNTIYERSTELKQLKEICNYFDNDNDYTTQELLEVWEWWSDINCAGWLMPGSVDENSNEYNLEQAESSYITIKYKINEMKF